MKIQQQSISNQSVMNSAQAGNVNFKKLIVKKGSFDALKQCKNFQCETYQANRPLMLNFYKKLLNQKRIADKNELYNVVFKPGIKGGNSKGKVAIEDAEGREQFGFTTSFEQLTAIDTYIPLSHVTKEEEPNFWVRWFKNYLVNKQNKSMDKKAVDFETFLGMVMKRVEEIVNNAEYLKERHIQKEALI